MNHVTDERTDRPLDRELHHWLERSIEELPDGSELPPAIRADVLRRLPSTPQRRSVVRTPGPDLPRDPSRRDVSNIVSSALPIRQTARACANAALLAKESSVGRNTDCGANSPHASTADIQYSNEAMVMNSSSRRAPVRFVPAVHRLVTEVMQ